MGGKKLGHAERARIAAVRSKHGRRVDARAERERTERRRQSARVTPLALTKDTAAEFVKLEAAGLPYAHVFHYLASQWWATLDDDQRNDTIAAWLASPLVARAASTFNGALWQDLDRDARVELALSKHASQLAYLLYTHNPSDTIDKLTLEKIKDARTALFEMQRIAQGGEQGAFAKMVADLLAGKVEGQTGMSLEPPRESDEGEDPTPGTGVPLGTSVPIEALDFGIPVLPKGQRN